MSGYVYKISNLLFGLSTADPAGATSITPTRGQEAQGHQAKSQAGMCPWPQGKLV